MKPIKTIGLNYNTSNLRVCIDSISDGAVIGRVYSMRLSKPIEFSDINELILKVETVLDAQNFPRAFQRRRVFGNVTATGSPYVQDTYMDEQTVASASGELFTFTLQVLTRMNTTWQGMIDWLDGSKNPVFESALKFLSIVDERIESYRQRSI